MLHLTDTLMNLFKSLEEDITFMNNHGNFIVVEWYKRGLINDKSIIPSRGLNDDSRGNAGTNWNNNEEDVQVDSGDISYVIVHIISPNRAFFDSDIQYGKAFDRLKFNVSEI